jgi:TatD DNase family protein
MIDSRDPSSAIVEHPPIYVDSHAHLTAPELLPDLQDVLQRAREARIKGIVNICTDTSSLHASLPLSGQHPSVVTAAAVHPHDAQDEPSPFFATVREHAQGGRLAAIGETGLDYYYERASKEAQKRELLRHVELALSLQLPLVFHCREAFSDLFALMDAEYRGERALLHCFTGSLSEARGVLDRGWRLSFSGVVTFKKSEALREVVRYAPLDRLMVETDAPYLAPQSRRGRRNEPAFIAEIIEKIAEAKGASMTEVADATAQNAWRFFSFAKEYKR